MYKQFLGTLFAVFFVIQVNAQVFSGQVKDKNGSPIPDVEVYVVEDDETIKTNTKGIWSYTISNKDFKTLVFFKEGYAYEQLNKIKPSSNINTTLRELKKSLATLREEGYVKNGCSSVNIPNNSDWNIDFEITTLKGDLAPDSKYTRRDPSAVIKVGDLYYVWYSYSLTFDDTKTAPWDFNDLYYAVSKDGITWEEKGLAVGRGEAGSYDARSVFTTEVLVSNGKYYLVYQAAADLEGIRGRNTVGMAYADNPNGPWTKLAQPVLTPTYTKNVFFDNKSAHDPCIITYNNKFYLYYKGECGCMDNEGCIKWCNPVCGLRKQVKWGVAISDSPIGPYVKSEFNPITNTGHEVMVWPYADGVAILQHQDGPEPLSIQYSKDGLNFEIKGKVTGFPEAAGLYRTKTSDTNPHSGVSWGMGHKLKWNAGPKGWMYIYRFDKK
ncbi:family 43 glycosylhydrolase [Seonamhaeicola marinus]|uniref:Family 43 glycosylhydrolase n=1 Tax=Seonamhaeicola marinus TaxID=1912246 RepID=A0A5D0J745_9FLAO|nr:family 43 glycosylhydrolase [Seonamhaeicola marinus]TYA92185.1 family 43 glycosylhydrolase [Seonamhaeicola marinus]